MEIKVKIHRLFNDDYSNIRGTASMTIDGVWAVHGIKIMMHRNGGVWVALPSAKGNNGYYDVVHPLTAALRKQMNDAVLNEYRRVLAIEEKRAANSGEELSAQVEIAENNIPYRESEVTLFDMDTE